MENINVTQKGNFEPHPFWDSELRTDKSTSRTRHVPKPTSPDIRGTDSEQGTQHKEDAS